MAQWPDVVRAMTRIEGAVRDQGKHLWRVADKLFAWERPLRKSDLEALGDSAPTGPILGVRVPLEVKEALLASKKKAYFTTPHFDGYPAILVHLSSIRADALVRFLEAARVDQPRQKVKKARPARLSRRRG